MFLSLNSINIVLLVLYIYAVSKFFAEKKLKWGIACLYIGVPMLMLGTKTSMLMVIAVPAVFFFINIKDMKVWVYASVVAALGVLAGIFFWDKISAAFGGMFARQISLFKQRDFFTYLFSTRNLRVIKALEYYADTFSLIDIFPGRGYFGIHHVIAKYENLWIQPMEMDWVDILISYGPVGFLYTYWFAIKQIWKTRRIAADKDGQAYLFTAIIILVYGSLAGHLFLEAMPSTFYAVIIAGCAVTEKTVYRL